MSTILVQDIIKLKSLNEVVNFTNSNSRFSTPNFIPFVIKHSWEFECVYKSRRRVSSHSAAESSRKGVALMGDLHDIVLFFGALPHPPDPVIGSDRHDDLLLWTTVGQVYGVIL